MHQIDTYSPHLHPLIEVADLFPKYSRYKKQQFILESDKVG